MGLTATHTRPIAGTGGSSLPAFGPAESDKPAVESGGVLTYHDTSWVTHTSTLSTYTGATSFSSGTVTISDKLISSDLIALSGSTVNLTVQRCKMSGHFDFDQAGATLTLIDSEIDGTTWAGATVGFGNVNGYRSWIHGGNEGVLSSGVSHFEYCLMNQLFLAGGSSAHCNGFISNGNGTNAVSLSHCTIHGDVNDNGSGGGVSTNCSFFPDFAIISLVTIDHCLFPATPGGYSVSLGWNPGKTHNADVGNATNISFTNNALERTHTVAGLTQLQGGVFGTITGWNADVSNTFSGNVDSVTGVAIGSTDV